MSPAQRLAALALLGGITVCFLRSGEATAAAVLVAAAYVSGTSRGGRPR